VTTPQDKRAAAIKAMERHDISQRRACRLVSVDPKTVSRTKVPDNPDIRAKMREIAGQRRRFGYRRIGLMLEREGIMMNHKKLRRIYGEEGLSVKRRRGRKRALGTRAPMLEPSGPSVRWSLDFVSDSFGDGRRFRILAVIDDFTRECLALVADTSLSGARVARELDRIIRLYGKPQMIVSDNVLHSDTQASFGRRSSSRIFQIRALKSIAGWASATMEELSAIANTGSMRSVVAGPHRP
jgi:putative transposase